MRQISAVIIMTHESRAAEADVVRKLVKLQCEPLGIPVLMSLDQGWNNPRKNLMQCLTLPASGGLKRVVIHDDLIMPKDVFRKLDHILAQLPKAVFVSAYCPANAGYDEAFEKGHHVLLTATNIWSQAFCFPESVIPTLVKFNEDEIADDFRYADRPITIFQKWHRMKTHCIVPSLFQHIGAYRSTLGFAGKVFKRYRYSDHFDPDFDPYAVDWKHELENAATSEVPIDMKRMMADETA